ncbi:S8 family serine peptidase [Novosphingobium sp. KCTC 2891]|uniref:S8 family serine peptidase n=1 Tax=Novosphingobium sp. KCTC 2891 TaxID=2989730 RepID=UPI0022212CFF|nr:S8 family serine peptidase [Novosphingobium sp. KCTC 2891]MCW1384067.1 S8 family serine peptidase [Novosphingobium sp. KCTC 2891]
MITTAAVLALMGAPLGAQVLTPAAGEVLGTVTGVAGRIGAPVLDDLARLPQMAEELARRRVDRLARLVRQQRRAVETDEEGQPARRGVLLVIDPPQDLEQSLEGTGFRVAGRERLADIGLALAQVETPAGLTLARAQERLRKALPGASVTADNLLFPGGGRAAMVPPAKASAPAPSIAGRVGVIDGGAAGQVDEQRGFATGAPLAGNHGSAVVSLLHGAGVRRILLADVYGADPAGGNALAIARAFDWLVGKGVPVITISLVGPANPLLARAVAAAQRRGATVVAPVGNDGPAAPPAYPASFPGVLAVTGVDGRNRPLIEAGRALHLDYAAPGGDVQAADARGRRVTVRGTSFAAPLVAARAAAAGGNVRQALDREAVDLGRKGPDESYGRGLLCGTCRRGL